jgi:hypothetical protein
MSTNTSVSNNIKIRSRNDVGKRALFYSKAFIQRLVARKPMSQIQAEIETLNELRRTLHWVLLTAIGLGCMIGE